MLIQLLKAKIAREGISHREAARQIGFSNTTLMGILNGRKMDVKSLKLISKWLDVPTSILLAEDDDEFLITALQTLRETPLVAQILKAGGDLLEKEVITMEIFDAWIDFLAFKIYRKPIDPIDHDQFLAGLLSDWQTFQR